MESRSFIKAAGALINKIEEAAGTMGSYEEMGNQREAYQKEVTSLFSNIYLNPTLPSAFRLRDAALRNGYTVPAMARERLASFEHWSA